MPLVKIEQAKTVSSLVKSEQAEAVSLESLDKSEKAEVIALELSKCEQAEAVPPLVKRRAS